MMISVQDAEFKGNTMARYLQIFADTGVVVDMISQSAPHGTSMDFSFTAYSSDLPLVMKAISAANLDKDAKASPLISVGYSKLNLFGEEMVTSCGVAARALNALAMAGSKRPGGSPLCGEKPAGSFYFIRRFTGSPCGRPSCLS